MYIVRIIIILLTVFIFCSDKEKETGNDKREILFLYTDKDHQQDTQVHVMNETGVQLRMITSGERDYFKAVWSKTKKYLALLSGRGSTPVSQYKPSNYMIQLADENRGIFDSIPILTRGERIFHWGVDDDMFFYTVGNGGANPVIEWYQVEKERWFDYRKGKLFYYLSGNDTIKPNVYAASLSKEVLFVFAADSLSAFYEMNYEGEILSEISSSGVPSYILKACYFADNSKIAFTYYSRDDRKIKNTIYVYDLKCRFWSEISVPFPNGFDLSGFALDSKGEILIVSLVKRENERTFPEESMILKVDMFSFEYEEIFKRDSCYLSVQEFR